MVEGFLAGLRPRKVVVLRASRIGDFVCATPALRALRAALPEAEITYLALPLVRDLAIRLPWLDRFVAFPGFPGIAEQLFQPHEFADFIGCMQRERFDLALQLHGSGAYSNPVALLLGARATAGFVRQGEEAGLLDAAMPFPDTGREAERLLALTSYLGAPPKGMHPQIGLTAQDRAHAGSLLAGYPAPLIGVHPDARETQKRWDPCLFGRVAAELQSAHGGTVVIVGAPGTWAAAEAIVAMTRGPASNLAGRTTLPTLAATIERLDLLLTNDTGPAHLAYALAQPTVTLFFTTDACRWGPPAAGPHRVVTGPEVTVADVLVAAEAVWGFAPATR